MTRVTRPPAQGGLEGLQPSKKTPFLVVVAGEAGNHHQKKKISGRLRLPKPLHYVTVLMKGVWIRVSILHARCGSPRRSSLKSCSWQPPCGVGAARCT